MWRPRRLHNIRSQSMPGSHRSTISIIPPSLLRRAAVRSAHSSARCRMANSGDGSRSRRRRIFQSLLRTYFRKRILHDASSALAWPRSRAFRAGPRAKAFSGGLRRRDAAGALRHADHGRPRLVLGDCHGLCLSRYRYDAHPRLCGGNRRQDP